MTVEEAIEKLEFLNEALNFQRHDADECSCALQMGIDAIKEIQHYRAIGLGSPEEVEQDLILYKADREVLREFEAIGTVSEFQQLNEKATAKKPIPIDYEKYTEVVKNAKLLRGAYWCPNCNHVVKSGDYCNDCGQKLLWD